MGLFSFLGFSKNKREKKAHRRFDRSIDEQERRRDRLDRHTDESRDRFLGARGEHLDRLREFDPRAAATEAAGAFADEAGEKLEFAEGARTRASNRRGFLGTPSGTGSQMRDFNRRLSRRMAQLAQTFAAMEQGRIDRFGDVARADQSQLAFDAGRGDRANLTLLDLIAGGRDAAQASQNARRGTTLGLLETATSAIPFL